MICNSLIDTDEKIKLSKLKDVPVPVKLYYINIFK